MSDFLGPIEAAIARRRKRGLSVARLHDIELSEVSVVDLPANEGARHLLHKHLHQDPVPAPLEPVPAHELARLAKDAVAKVCAEIAGREARITAIADRMTAAPIAKSEGKVAEALTAADAGEERDQEFWAAALRDLGRTVAPDLPPADQAHRALADPRGVRLLRAKLGMPRL
jgi:hypothetical protein